MLSINTITNLSILLATILAAETNTNTAAKADKNVVVRCINTTIKGDVLSFSIEGIFSTISAELQSHKQDKEKGRYTKVQDVNIEPILTSGEEQPTDLNKENPKEEQPKSTANTTFVSIPLEGVEKDPEYIYRFACTAEPDKKKFDTPSFMYNEETSEWEVVEDSGQTKRTRWYASTFFWIIAALLILVVIILLVKSCT